MNIPDQGDVTRLLKQARAGSDAARDELAELIYPELRRLAGRALKADRPHHTLQATALAHELYMRLFMQQECLWQDRAHFFAAASLALRRILTDYARMRRSAKRGGQALRVEFEDDSVIKSENLDLVLAIDEALVKLSQWDNRQASIVIYKYFGGLTELEISSVLGVSTRTVKRDFSMAKAWLSAMFGRCAPDVNS